MRRYLYIICTLALLALYGCQKDIDLGYIEEKPADNIEVLEDGRIRVEVSLKSLGMTSISTRADLSYENKIYNGWCLVFGETDGGENLKSDGCGDDSPLIQAVPIIANEAGKFFMTFNEYKHKAFIRIAANLTARENENFENVTTWQTLATQLGLDPTIVPSRADVEKYRDDDNYNLATFGEYRQQSVGLDGLYNISYNTTSKLEFDAAGHTDYSGATTYWNINYQNKDFPGIKGSNYITNEPETYNGNKPNPTTQLNTTKGFPMSSYDYSLENLTEKSIEDAFGTIIKMVRTCSKVMINAADPTFTIQEVYLVDCAQESRIRSTTMDDITADNADDALGIEKQYNIPKDLGGTITYEALKVPEGTKITDPIYFYPNSGQDYINSDGSVNQNTNQQFIVIKGKSERYATSGYYKIALKAQYPLVKNPDTSAMGNRKQWTALTYDIWRNTSFTVNLVEVGKPGYKTLENTLDPACPASNINYDITVEHNDNHYEVLVSNGTFHVELETSRVYVKGYMNEGLEGCYIDFSLYPSKAGNYVPTVYVQSCDHDGIFNDEDVTIQYCNVMYKGEDGFESDDWSKTQHKVGLIDNETGDNLSAQLVKIPKSDKATKFRVFYKVKDSGRIRIHIGDIVKAIPIIYDAAPISYLGTHGESVKVNGTYGVNWDDFSYREVVYDKNHKNGVTGFELNSNGSVNFNNTDHFNRKPELRARISPQNAGDGLAVLYLRQASDFKLEFENKEILDDTEYKGTRTVEFTPQSKVWTNNTDGLFSGDRGDDKIVFTTITSKDGVSSESVDPLTIDIDTEITTKDNNGNDVNTNGYWNPVFSDNNQTLALTVKQIAYEKNGYVDINKTTRLLTKHSSDISAGESTTDPFVDYTNTAKSTIKVINSAGDQKTYTVYQKQEPPIYVVAPRRNKGIEEYATTTSWFNKRTENACLFAINLYNYDEDESTVTFKWTKADDKDLVENMFYISVVGDDFLTKYNKNTSTGATDNGQSDDYSTTKATGTRTSGNKSKDFNPVREFCRAGGYVVNNTNTKDKVGDAAIAFIRDLSEDGISLLGGDKTATIEYTITDKRFTEGTYKEVYTITKDYKFVH